MSKVVKSPAGESVEIVNDEDWMTLTGAMPQSMRAWAGSNGGKAATIRTLWEHGQFTDKSGRAARYAAEYLNSHGYTTDRPMPALNISAIFNTPVNAPAVEREINGKRTYSIKLVAMPDIWYRKLLADIESKPYTNGDTPAAPVAEVPQEAPQPLMKEPGPIITALTSEPITDAEWLNVRLDAPTLYEPSAPAIEIEMASQVAMSLLTTVVEIISAGSADTTKLAASKRLVDDLERTQVLLSQRLDENGKLRRQLREAADHINALKVERDGLRMRLQSTEYNLTQVLKGETAQVVNQEIHKRIDAIMRTTPTEKGD